MKTIHIAWKEDADGNVGWNVPDGAGRRDFLFEAALVNALPRDLRDRHAVEKFQEFAHNAEFQRWWLASCGNAQLAQPRFLLHFPADEAWTIAWELLLGELRYGEPAHVSIVRGVDTPKPPLASCFEEKLRILIIKGDPGQPTLDLDAEVEGVLRAFTDLSSLRANAEAPVVFDGPLARLSKAISESTPHVVWFSGHGRASTAAFLMHGGWALPGEIAGAISASGHIPPIAVFWACHTGAKGKQREIGGKFPAMFEALRAIGVHSVLAMQAPVYDGNAAEMARELFLNLAAGRPLDFAAAAARGRVFEQTLRLDSTFDRDWACPVVWSSAVPAEDLKWHSQPARRLAQLQLAGQGTVDVSLTRIGASFDPRDYAAAAGAWIDFKRTWVTGLLGVENDLHWAATLIAMQQANDRFVLAVDLEEGSAAEALQRWAEKVQQRLGRRDFPADDFLPALERLRANPADGWSRFAGLPGAVLAIRNPPSSSETWFWDAIVSNMNPVIVFRSAATLAEAPPIPAGWRAEKIDMANPTDFAAARKAAPKLVDTLAMLDMPTSKAQLAAVQIDAGDIARVASVLIETRGNFILRARAASYALEQMSADERIEAHERCLGILDHHVRLTSSVRERRVSHCLGAIARKEAALEALSLFAMYRAEERPRAAVQLFERTAAVQAVQASAYIFVAWAYTMLGDIDEAEVWLRKFPPRNADEGAWAEGISAEIWKARGERDEALAAIGRAIAILENAAAGAAGRERDALLRNMRIYRQDHARIRQYLFRDLEKAGAEYEALLAEWRSEPGADIEIAVVLRNYQECVRSLSKVRGDARWEEARDMLRQAWDHLADYRDTTIASEVLYEMSKFAAEDGRLQDAEAALREAGDIAARSGHLMLYAIIQARTFWASGPFDYKRWTLIADNLAAHPDHGWPVRALLGGRLRAAKRLLQVGDRDRALDELRTNSQTLARHPAFREGSDRFRIAATAAGLGVLGEQDAWTAFVGLGWAADWMREHNYADATSVWEAADGKRS